MKSSKVNEVAEKDWLQQLFMYVSRTPTPLRALFAHIAFKTSCDYSKMKYGTKLWNHSIRTHLQGYLEPKSRM